MPPPPDDPNACTGTCAQTIADYFLPPVPPTADASNSTNLVGPPNLTVMFNASASTDDEGIVSYEWDFDDAGATGTGLTDTYQYTSSGVYYPTLTVTDARGLQDTDTLTVTVSAAPIPPTADASESTDSFGDPDDLSGVVPLYVDFDGTASTDDDHIAEYHWDLGDGNTSTGWTDLHLYTAVGTYIATLTVTDTDGLTDSTTLTVRVLEPGPPTADLSASRNLKGAAPLLAEFDLVKPACEGDCTYEWDFGNGDTDETSLPGVGYQYDTPGEYTATVTVTTSNGLTDTDSITVKVVEGESLADYVAACKTQVGFSELPDFNCYDGLLFAESNVDGEPNNFSVTREFVGHERINNDVDMVFACRWLFGDRDNPRSPESVEMLVHNRPNGNTCFFAAKDGSADSSSTEISHSLASPTSPDAGDFWEEPAAVDGGDRRCVECHVAGPIIASPRVVDELAILGLLNNGHDTFVNPTDPDAYHAVTPSNGGAFTFWDQIIQENNVADSCASGCHTIGHNSTKSVVDSGLPELLPSISKVIDLVAEEGAMPPDNAFSPYRWINLDSIDGSGDRETFSESKSEYPELLGDCEVPTVLEARVVGREDIFTAPHLHLPDEPGVFNLQDGLRCVNAEQRDGACYDYETRYLCDGEWTGWYNMDDPSFQGDNESRSQISGLCASPTAIQARATVGAAVYLATGPNDRLAQLTPYGLVCNNADQSDGQCDNYVVRYRGCTDAPEPYETGIASAWSGNLLTATATQNDAETRAQPENASWSSQDWIVEPVENSPNVRIKNVWTGRYLNVRHDGEDAKVATYDLVPEWTSQQWAVEPVAGGEVRLRNVWSNRYLTVVDTGDYAEILSKSLNTDWPSQRWRLD